MKKGEGRQLQLIKNKIMQKIEKENVLMYLKFYSVVTSMLALGFI